MSSLDKLAIRGIRSFDHNELCVIQFYSPLTVIVGHNGSGKTTIIECLKYATTGDLPPNTKGGAFVHDPSIAGVSEVKAQVKLRFFNTQRQKYLVERRLQVSKKKTGTGLTMKTLEGMITLVDEDAAGKNKRTSLSTKCAALDEEVPMQLGVSKAILENVIFCHQEESNWPLSEPAALKKKFDDIFDATRYTKALDHIKVLRKEQAIEIKVDKEKLSAIKIDRDRATKLTATISKLSDAIDVKQSDHDDLESRIVKIVAENKSFFNQATKHQDILSKASTLKTQKDLIEDNLVQVRANLHELKDTDEELQKRIGSHEADLEASRRERESLMRNLEDEQDAQDRYEKKRSQAQNNHGRLLAEKQRYETNLQNRTTLIQAIASRHEINGYDHELSRNEIKEFEAKLEEAIDAQNKKIQELKDEARKLDTKRQEEISALKIAKAADEQARQNNSMQTRSANSRVRDLNRKLEGTQISIADITYAESQLKEERKRKSELEESIHQLDTPQQLKVKASQRRELEEQREQLHADLTSLNLQADVRAKLALKKTENGRKDEAIQSLLDKSAPKFRQYTKIEPSRATMEAEVNALIKVSEQDIVAAERLVRDANRELSAVETSVNLTRTKIKDLQAVAEENKRKITAGLKGLDTEAKTVEAAIIEAENEVELSRNELMDSEGFAKFYHTLLNAGKKDKVCLGCDRSISSKEIVEFERYCKQQQDRAPKRAKQAQADLDGWEEQLSTLKKLSPIEVAQNHLIKEELPAAEKEAERHSIKLPAATAKAQETVTRLSELKASFDDLQLLRRSASDIARLCRECDDISRDIAKLEGELSATGSASTSDDIQAELTKLAEQIRTLAQAEDKLRNESQQQGLVLQRLTESIHASELSLGRKRQELADKEALESEKEEVQERITQLEQESKEMDQRIKNREGPLRKAEEEAAEGRRQFASTEASALRELSAYNKSVEQLEMNAKEIRVYIAKGGNAELDKCERELQQHEKVVDEKKKAVQKLQATISKIEKTLADSAAILRNFQDNVQLRDGHKKIENYQKEIDSLDVPSAEKAYRKFDAEYTTMRKNQADLQAQQAKLGGEIEMMRRDLDDKRVEMKDEYDNIEEKYKIELVKVKTAEVANMDLEKYGKALDSAIMAFHGHKMEEINSTIHDLWIKTYQGTDIDKIMIKSDAEGKGVGGRSYNYRVVMLKDDTEMDMRGRCSAGQKVLASIIIRLALAESFGIDCGILALDEPTTNLDQDNIQALARSLSELIKDRQGQPNFQLVVITHDEHFLETLGGAGVLDKYWRVSRGDGGQKSTIERQRLS